MSDWTTKPKDDDTRFIEQVLRPTFPRTDVDRQNSASIRVHIVDECFCGRSKIERENMVFPKIDDLPDEIRSDITVLLLLTEEEMADSMMNLELEKPTPSVL